MIVGNESVGTAFVGNITLVIVEDIKDLIKFAPGAESPEDEMVVVVEGVWYPAGGAHGPLPVSLLTVEVVPGREGLYKLNTDFLTRKRLVLIRGKNTDTGFLSWHWAASVASRPQSEIHW